MVGQMMVEQMMVGQMIVRHKLIDKHTYNFSQVLVCDPSEAYNHTLQTYLTNSPHK